MRRGLLAEKRRTASGYTVRRDAWRHRIFEIVIDEREENALTLDIFMALPLYTERDCMIHNKIELDHITHIHYNESACSGRMSPCEGSRFAERRERRCLAKVT